MSKESAPTLSHRCAPGAGRSRLQVAARPRYVQYRDTPLPSSRKKSLIPYPPPAIKVAIHAKHPHQRTQPYSRNPKTGEEGGGVRSPKHGQIHDASWFPLKKKRPSPPQAACERKKDFRSRNKQASSCGNGLSHFFSGVVRETAFSAQTNIPQYSIS